MLLILGSDGMLARELGALMERRALRFERRNRAQCDITRPAEVERAVKSSGATLVINCAAYNAVDQAEKEPQVAMAVNGEGPGNIARAAPALVHYSTDFVFDGKKASPYVESDAPHPQSAYARSKAAGDAAVQHNPHHFLLRVGNLYASGGRGFGSMLLGRLRRGERIKADDERQVQPSWCRAVAAQTLAVVDHGQYGLYHTMCHGRTTWAEFGREMARLAGFDPGLIEATSFAALNLPAKRPLYAVLENRALAQAGIDRMPDWQVALEAYLDEELSK